MVLLIKKQENTIEKQIKTLVASCSLLILYFTSTALRQISIFFASFSSHIESYWNSLKVDSKFPAHFLSNSLVSLFPSGIAFSKIFISLFPNLCSIKAITSFFPTFFYSKSRISFTSHCFHTTLFLVPSHLISLTIDLSDHVYCSY